MEQPLAAAHRLAVPCRVLRAEGIQRLRAAWLAPKPGEGKGDSEAHTAAQSWL